MSESKREKSARPFYELPAHIKPCSRIIQETRMQLRYGGKLLASGNSGEHGDISPCSSANGVRQRGPNEFPNPANYGDSIFYNDEDAIMSSSSGSSGGMFTGIKAVHTQRPKTGNDHDMSMFWGMSSRKRPPSAITLSRLSLDDIDEKRPTFKTAGNQSRPMTGSLDVPDETSIISSSKDVERTRLKFKSISVSSMTENEEARRSLRLRLEEDSSQKDKLDQNGTKERKKRGCVEGANINNNIHHPTKRNSKNEMKHESETASSYEPSQNLLLAVNYLNSLVIPPINAEKPLKSELITALQNIKSCIGEIENSPELKHRLLKLIFKLVERNQNDEDLMFWASFVLLHCKIIGNNLTTVFKMVFKASRSKEYWSIIQETEYLDVFMESFGQTCPITQTESMIYGYGTLKFICMEQNVLSRIVELNLIPIMALHLKLLNYEVAKLKVVPENIFNGAFQLTSILRNIVGEESSLNVVVSSGLLEELCNSLEWAVDDIDVLSVIVRILSVVSGDNVCCQVISGNSTFTKSIVRTLQMWHVKDDVIVRLTYCLGNLLAQCETMRIKMYDEPGCYQMILQLISFYMERFSPISEDILIKSIRILANWSLNTAIGAEICDDPQLCEILNIILKTKDISDELLICVISTLNNTTFYKNYTITDEATIQTAEHLYEYLTMKNLEARTEVLKVLGNLTRNNNIRRVVAEHVEKLMISLEEDNDELLCATVGVLMNIIVNTKAAQEFFQRQGIEMLLRLLESKTDIGLNLMILQFIWNIQISCETSYESIPESERALFSSDSSPTSDSSPKLANTIDSEKRMKIRNLIRRKLDSISQTTQSEDFPFLDLVPEFQSLAERLHDKLSENEQ